MARYELVSIEFRSAETGDATHRRKIEMPAELYDALTAVTGGHIASSAAHWLDTYLLPESMLRSQRYDDLLEQVGDWLDKPEDGNRRVLKLAAELYRYERSEPTTVNSFIELLPLLPDPGGLLDEGLRNLAGQ